MEFFLFCHMLEFTKFQLLDIWIFFRVGMLGPALMLLNYHDFWLWNSCASSYEFPGLSVSQWPPL